MTWASNVWPDNDNETDGNVNDGGRDIVLCIHVWNIIGIMVV